MSDWTVLGLATAAAYLLGSVPFGVILARWNGVAIREHGSGNIGATNVARTVGKGMAAIVLVLDAAKGAAVLGLEVHTDLIDLSGSIPAAVIALGLAPILGHCFSPWLRFRGGKGVATSLGVMLACAPIIAGGAVATFAVIYALTRVASLASLAAAGGAVLLFATIGPGGAYTQMMIGAALIILIQHRANIRRLLGHSELQV